MAATGPLNHPCEPPWK